MQIHRLSYFALDPRKPKSRAHIKNPVIYGLKWFALRTWVEPTLAAQTNAQSKSQLAQTNAQSKRRLAQTNVQTKIRIFTVYCLLSSIIHSSAGRLGDHCQVFRRLGEESPGSTGRGGG